MVEEDKNRQGQGEGDCDYGTMNNAESNEAMDMADEDVVTAEGEGCEGSGSGCAGSGPSEDEEECVSSPAGSHYDEVGEMKNAMSDEVTKQLAAAGPIGMAAAAAIASSKKRKRPHSFETNPSVRKRHQNRLLRKLRGLCRVAANDRGVRDARGPAGGGAGGDAGQAQHLVPRVRRQAAGGRGAQPALHDHGGAGERARAAGAAAAAGGSLAVRAAAAHHRRHPHARGEDDAGAAARLHTSHAQVLHGTRQAGLGAGVDATTLVAQGPALGQRAHGRAHRGREAEDVVDARAAPDRDQLLQVPRPRGPAARLHRGRRQAALTQHVAVRAGHAADHHEPGRHRVPHPGGPQQPHHHAARRHHRASDQRGRQRRGAGAGGRGGGGRRPQRGGRGHAQPRRTAHPHRRGRSRVSGVGVGRDHAARVGFRVPVHGGLHAAAGRRLRRAPRAGGAGRRGPGGAVAGRRRDASGAAGRRRRAAAASAQPQGCHRTHQGHATSEVGARGGGGGLLAAGLGVAGLAGGARIAPRPRPPGPDPASSVI